MCFSVAHCFSVLCFLSCKIEIAVKKKLTTFLSGWNSEARGKLDQWMEPTKPDTKEQCDCDHCSAEDDKVPHLQFCLSP